MVGNNTPVFFFRDPLKFIDLNHAVKRDPRTNMRSPNTNWDFWTSLPAITSSYNHYGRDKLFHPHIGICMDLVVMPIVL